jgi:transposase
LGDVQACGGLTPQQLFGWRRDAVTRRRVGDLTGGSSSAFAPVVAEAAQPRQMPVAPAQLSGSPMIEIMIGSAIIRIPPGTDAAALTMVLRAVKAAT